MKNLTKSKYKNAFKFLSNPKWKKTKKIHKKNKIKILLKQTATTLQ